VEIINRKARYEYHFLQKFEAGLALLGTEVKALRDGEANIGDAWCYFRGGELYLKNLHIGDYKYGSGYQHDPMRERKLLLKKSELRKLERKSKEKGLTIIPYRLYFSDTGYAKCEIVVAKGKKAYDKRESIKERDIQRDVDRLDKY
jgi:SsrA-binding protein